MDLGSISSGAVAASMKQKTGDAVGIVIARKSLDLQADTATQLINSVEKPVATESHLGGKFDGYA